MLTIQEVSMAIKSQFNLYVSSAELIMDTFLAICLLLHEHYVPASITSAVSR